MRRAVFLDRDGVINIDHAYVWRQSDFQWIGGVLESCRALSQKGYLLVVVTNQSGIARGYYSEAQYLELEQYMRQRFDQAGAPLANVYFCPHHPTEALPAYRCQCACRKPAPGMILQAAKELNIDLQQSVFFGDKRSDMQAAQAAGIPVRILVGTDARAVPVPVPECTLTAQGLSSALTGCAAFLLS